MDMLTNRLERLRRLKLEQRIEVNRNELDAVKNDIRFELLICGGSLDVIVSVLYWCVPSYDFQTVPSQLFTLVFLALNTTQVRKIHVYIFFKVEFI